MEIHVRRTPLSSRIQVDALDNIVKRPGVRIRPLVQYDGAQQPREGLRGRGGERRRLSWRGEAAQATGTRQRPAKHSASRRTPDGKTSRQISPSASLCHDREREQLLIW